LKNNIFKNGEVLSSCIYSILKSWIDYFVPTGLKKSRVIIFTNISSLRDFEILQSNCHETERILKLKVD
jgi:hypothetical protein